MLKLLNSELFERLLFTLIVVGILMTLFGAFKFIDISNQLATNEAAQIKRSGDEINPATTTEARGLVASDLERRDLVQERFNMMVVGGVGLAFIGAGWIISDILRSRRKKDDQPAKATASP